MEECLESLTLGSNKDANAEILCINDGSDDNSVNIIKSFELQIIGTRDFNEAIITIGGISTKEINPSTMESKLIKGLYMAGEMIDVDAYTGGYNLQIAWSTGHLAGLSVNE